MHNKDKEGAKEADHIVWMSPVICTSRYFEKIGSPVYECSRNIPVLEKERLESAASNFEILQKAIGAVAELWQSFAEVDCRLLPQVQCDGYILGWRVALV